MHRIAFATLAGFIAVPLNGTGALVGALLGRLMGLSRVAIVTATACGSVAASLALALASDLWAERINALVARPYLGLLSVAFVLTLTVLISRWALGGGDPPPPDGSRRRRA
jgi:predicted Na+-dependent transporter